MNGLFNTNGQDITSSAVGFTIYDTDGYTYEINRNPLEAAKMVYTNVFYNPQQDTYYSQTNLISGEFLNRKDLTPTESYPEAFVYNYDFDYLDLRETTYLITDVGNTNWYGNDYNRCYYIHETKVKR